MGSIIRDRIKAELEANERLVHRVHQLEGVEQLVRDTDPDRGRVIPGVFLLADEVGAGKTKQVVDSAQVLWRAGKIDTVVALTPGFARSTWADPDPMLGEVAKHSWPTINNVIHEYHRSYTDLDFKPVDALHWVVSNYEFIRRPNRLEQLIKLLGPRKVWLVLDESWALKGFTKQTRACRKLRVQRALRCTLLNGTPLSDGKPQDLFYPFAILDPKIIDAKNRTAFMNRYVVRQPMGQYNKTVGYQNIEELNRKIAPYVLSRRTRDCFDLPPMLPPLTLEAKLTDETWKIYRQQRDDMVAWLGNEVSVSKQAIVKVLRLSQITSGYLGGLVADDSSSASVPTAADIATMPDWMRKRLGLDDSTHSVPLDLTLDPAQPPPVAAPAAPITRELSREKLDTFLDWLRSIHRPNKILVWCRFRAELERATKAMSEFYPRVLNLKGGQTPDERTAAKSLLAPGSDPAPGAVVGNQKAGGASLNFAAASIAAYLSNGPALIERTQSIGRIERPGATQPMLIVDVVATGPKGQKTIDHHTLHALRSKDDMARWTVDQWRKILRGEE